MKQLAFVALAASLLASCIKTEPVPAGPPAVVTEPSAPIAPAPDAQPASPVASGTCSSASCSEMEYCASEVMGCGEVPGSCQPRPEMCTQEYRPVCGCDGKTYPNRCAAMASGAQVQADGACEEVASERITCGGIAGKVCPDGMSCIDDPTDGCTPAKGGADCLGICTAAATPEPACKPVLCKMYCKNGWKRDANGCEICACR